MSSATYIAEFALKHIINTTALVLHFMKTLLYGEPFLNAVATFHGAVKTVTLTLTHLPLSLTSSLTLTLFLIIMNNGVMTLKLEIDNVQLVYNVIDNVTKNRTLSINRVSIFWLHKYSHFIS